MTCTLIDPSSNIRPSRASIIHYWTLPLLDLIRSIQHYAPRPRPIAAAPLAPQTTRPPSSNSASRVSQDHLANESGQPRYVEHTTTRNVTGLSCDAAILPRAEAASTRPPPVRCKTQHCARTPRHS